MSNVLQDMLRLITLWFDYGALPQVNQAMHEGKPNKHAHHARHVRHVRHVLIFPRSLALSTGFNRLTVDTWLYVIPQLIARIHTTSPHIQGLLHQLLCEIGRTHPQALIYPLTVAAHSEHTHREQAAKAVLARMREHRWVRCGGAD